MCEDSGFETTRPLCHQLCKATLVQMNLEVGLDVLLGTFQLHVSNSSGTGPNPGGQMQALPLCRWHTRDRRTAGCSSSFTAVVCSEHPGHLAKENLLKPTS